MKATKLAKVCHREMMRRGMSGMQLASAAGVSQATLSRWFNGKQSLNDALLAKVFTVLELVVTRRL